MLILINGMATGFFLCELAWFVFGGWQTFDLVAALLGALAFFITIDGFPWRDTL